MLPIVVGLHLLPSTARSEGLIRKLPEDGVWARFEVEGRISHGTEASQRFDSTGSLTISSVGREVVKGEPCRWIEAKSQGPGLLLVSAIWAAEVPLR